MKNQYCIPDNVIERMEYIKQRKNNLDDKRVGSIYDFLYDHSSVVVKKVNDNNESISSFHSDDEDNTSSIILIQ